MFKPDEILTLAKAGFTAQQIAGLSMINNPAPVPQPAPAPVPQPAPAPVPQPAPAPAPAPAPVPQPAPAPVDPVLAELQKLTGLVQGSNIMNVNQPKVQTPEEILAEIINPAPKGEK
jgi:hypothetical protein|nr:MAG TPA: translation initiation factor-like protein [Caudoviricetes sp.]